MRAQQLVAMIGALATVLTGAVTSAVVTSGSAVAAPSCPKMYVVAIPGTWETSEHPGRRARVGMLGGVTRGLPSSIRTAYVPYMATAFPWEGGVYGRSKQEAIDHARGMIAGETHRCPGTKIGIIGFSQGADAAGDLAAEIGSGRGVVPPSQVAAVGLLSDPRRSPTDALIGAAVGGAGVSGPRIGGFGALTPVTKTFCLSGDVYCSTPDGDLAVRMAGFLAQATSMNLSSLANFPQQFHGLLGDVLQGHGGDILRGQFTDKANERRARRLQDFYNSGVHNGYGTRAVAAGTTPTNWLHNYLIRQAG